MTGNGAAGIEDRRSRKDRKMTGWLAGLSNQPSPTKANTQPATMATSSDKGGSTDNTSASIAANDFLTLLVTEMKNQDPTATTDPNEYVNQLVQVNSLQQLIAINETLKGAVTTAAKADGAASTGGVAGAPTTAKNGDASTVSHPELHRAAGGNLGFLPRESGASRVATALGGR
jgi:flagellar basal-body rod modification protein FlgD